MRLLLAAVAAPVVWAGDFAIDWWSVDGGGGMSAGGQYALAGAIGQPDAGVAMAGGTYSVTGGFWALPTSAAPPPELFIQPGPPGFVTVGWTPATIAFTLESTARLVPSDWVEAESGTNNPAILSTAADTGLYRLRRPRAILSE